MSKRELVSCATGLLVGATIGLSIGFWRQHKQVSASDESISTDVISATSSVSVTYDGHTEQVPNSNVQVYVNGERTQ